MLSAALIAIQMLHPKLADNTANQYAAVIDQQAVVAGVDPLTFVAIIEHESRFDQFAVSDDKMDRGLMQVRAQYYKGKADWLFNPKVNIAAGAHVIKSVVDMCTKHLGHTPDMASWGSCYLGSCGSRASFCRPTKKSMQRQQFHDCLIDVVYSDKDIKACQAIYN